MLLSHLSTTDGRQTAQHESEREEKIASNLASKAGAISAAASQAASASRRLAQARRSLIYDGVTKQWVRAPATHLNRAGGSPSGQGMGGLEAKTERLLKPRRESETLHAAPVQETPPEPETSVAGLAIPRKPVAPSDEDCCQSGCAICVYDIYAEELEAYELAIKLARAELEPKWEEMKARGESWPTALGPEPRPHQESESNKSGLEREGSATRQAGAQMKKEQSRHPTLASRSASLSAFEALERKLGG